MTEEKTARKSRRATRYTLDEVAELVGAERPSQVEADWDFWETYSYVYNEAIRDGATVEAADEKALAAESDERDDLYRKMVAATLRAAERILREHDLTLRAVRTRKDGTLYEIRPVMGSTWRKVLDALRETINGYGMFYFGTVRQLMDSLPTRSTKKAAEDHLGWMRDWASVYGATSAKHEIERAMRH